LSWKRTKQRQQQWRDQKNDGKRNNHASKERDDNEEKETQNATYGTTAADANVSGLDENSDAAVIATSDL
jgi:hypothetical protein